MRWNTLADCLESYTSNWHCLAKVCSENRSEIDLDIVKNVQDVELKEVVDIYLRKLKKISIALDLMQREMCTLSECTHIWKELLSGQWLEEEAKCLRKRTTWR